MSLDRTAPVRHITPILRNEKDKEETDAGYAELQAMLPDARRWKQKHSREIAQSSNKT